MSISLLSQEEQEVQHFIGPDLDNIGNIWEDYSPEKLSLYGDSIYNGECFDKPRYSSKLFVGAGWAEIHPFCLGQILTPQQLELLQIADCYISETPDDLTKHFVWMSQKSQTSPKARKTRQ